MQHDAACDHGVGAACFEALPGDAAVRVDIRETLDGDEIRDFTRGGLRLLRRRRGPWGGRGHGEVCGPTDVAIPEGAATLYVMPEWVPGCRGVFRAEATGVVATTGTMTATFT